MQKTIFSLTSDRGLGGISASLLTYSRAMALAGIRHIIAVPRITPVFDELAAMDNVEMIAMSSAQIRSHSLTAYRFAAQLRRIMEAADAIFIHNAKHANVPAPYRGKTYVINHNGKTKRLDTAPNIIFLNKTARDQFLDAFASLTTHHLVMGHGFDVSDEIQRSHDPEKPVQIISAGRLMEKKGYRDMVETARLLQKNNINCHISIFGEGPDEAYLKERIAAYGLTNFSLNGWTHNLRAELAKADIFCTPSHGESFPLVIGEALEAGLAIASTRTNGAREYFSYAGDNKPIGLLSDIHDHASMAANLTELTKDHSLRHAMNKNARAFLLDNFSLEILARKFDRLCAETAKRPRIFMATQTFPPRIGGMENVMKALAEKFAQSGHDVTVLPNRTYKVPSSYRVINLRLIKPLRIMVKRLALKLMLRDDDVVICDSWKSINVVTRTFNGRLVVLAHGQEFLKGSKREKTIETALRRSYRVVANSAFTAGLIRDRYQVDPQKIIVVPPTYMLDAEDKAQGPKENDNVELVSLCRLDPRKGLLQSMQALANSNDSQQDWHWTIIGDGVQADDLRRTADDLKLNDRISFLHDIDDEEKDSLLRSADLFIMPSFQNGNSVEGFGISYIEAARLGIPAIAGVAGGSREAVLDGETGWCVDTTDAEALQQTFRMALEAPDERAKRGAAARRRFQAELQGDIVFQRFIDEAIMTDENG